MNRITFLLLSKSFSHCHFRFFIHMTKENTIPLCWTKRRTGRYLLKFEVVFWDEMSQSELSSMLTWTFSILSLLPVKKLQTIRHLQRQKKKKSTEAGNKCNGSYCNIYCWVSTWAFLILIILITVSAACTGARLTLSYKFSQLTVALHSMKQAIVLDQRHYFNIEIESNS